MNETKHRPGKQGREDELPLTEVLELQAQMQRDLEELDRLFEAQGEGQRPDAVTDAGIAAGRAINAC